MHLGGPYEKVKYCDACFISFAIYDRMQRKTVSFKSNPLGFGLLEDTYVAKGSFIYDSKTPYYVNEITLELYYLPIVWGEIEINEHNLPALDNPNFLIIDYNLPTQKVYAKFIHIGQHIWTAEINQGILNYVNQNGNDINDVLLDEDEAKAYTQSIDMNDAYFLDHEMVMLTGYHSILDVLETGGVYQKIDSTRFVNINYTETLTAFPDLSIHFSEFISSEINMIFQRVFDHVDELEYRISISYD